MSCQSQRCGRAVTPRRSRAGRRPLRRKSPAARSSAGHPAPSLEATSAMVPSRSRMRMRMPPAVFLGPSIRDDMGDEELMLILESLAARLENALSTLVRPTASSPLRLCGLTAVVLQATGRLLPRPGRARTGHEDRPQIDRPCLVPLERTAHRMIPSSLPSSTLMRILATVSIVADLCNPHECTPSACAAGSSSIGDCSRSLRMEYATETVERQCALGTPKRKGAARAAGPQNRHRPSDPCV